jgi:hypothetical protein
VAGVVCGGVFCRVVVWCLVGVLVWDWSGLCALGAQIGLGLVLFLLFRDFFGVFWPRCVLYGGGVTGWGCGLKTSLRSFCW